MKVKSKVEQRINRQIGELWLAGLQDNFDVGRLIWPIFSCFCGGLKLSGAAADRKAAARQSELFCKAPTPSGGLSAKLPTNQPTPHLDLLNKEEARGRLIVPHLSKARPMIH